MTNRKALELLNDMQFKDEYQGKDEYTDMLLACKQALDKQIPKKVVTNYSAEKGALIRIRQCPNCGSFINNSGIEFYCFHCGQALDWRS